MNKEAKAAMAADALLAFESHIEREWSNLSPELRRAIVAVRSFASSPNEQCAILAATKLLANVGSQLEDVHRNFIREHAERN